MSLLKRILGVDFGPKQAFSVPHGSWVSRFDFEASRDEAKALRRDLDKAWQEINDLKTKMANLQVLSGIRPKPKLEPVQP